MLQHDHLFDKSTLLIEQAKCVVHTLCSKLPEGNESLVGAIETLLDDAVSSFDEYRTAAIGGHRDAMPERGEGGEITFTPHEAMDVYMEILECGGAIEGVGDAIHTLGEDAFMQNMGSAVSKLAKDLMQGDAIMPLYKWANEKFQEEDQ